MTRPISLNNLLSFLLDLVCARWAAAAAAGWTIVSADYILEYSLLSTLSLSRLDVFSIRLSHQQSKPKSCLSSSQIVFKKIPEFKTTNKICIVSFDLILFIDMWENRIKYVKSKSICWNFCPII
jgi:hypothetical protein